MGMAAWRWRLSIDEGCYHNSIKRINFNVAAQRGANNIILFSAVPARTFRLVGWMVVDDEL